MTLTNAQLRVISFIKDNENITTPNLFKEVNDLYSSKKSLRNVLNRLEDNHGFIESTKKGNTKTWAITERGTIYIEENDNNDTNADQIKVERPDEWDDQAIEDTLRDYFHNEYRPHLINEHEQDDEAVSLDVQHLAQYGNTDLADHLLEEPEQVIEAAEHVISDLGFLDDSPEVRIKNVYDQSSKSASELNEEDMDRLVVLEGVLQSASRPMMRQNGGVFECKTCHRAWKTNKMNKKGEAVPPTKCECGSTDFSLEEPYWEPVRHLNVKEKPGSGKRHDIRVEVTGALAKDKATSFRSTGSAVKVIGRLDTYKKKKNKSSFQLQVQANNIIIEDDKWDQDPLTPDERKEAESLKEEYGDEIIEALASSLASDRIAGMDLLKETMLVWQTGRFEDDGNIHVICIGEPGLAKSDLAGVVRDRYPRIIKASGTSASGVGLTAAVREDKIIGGYIAEAGSLAMADGGFHILDEAAKLSNEDMKKLNEALSDEQITLDKGNIHTEIPADTSSFAICNPEGGLFDSTMKLYKQIPIEYSELIDRYDIKIGLTRNDLSTDEERSREEDVLEAILDRDGGTDVVESGEDISSKVLGDYITLAQGISPVLSGGAKERLKEIYFQFRMAEDAGENLWDRRRIVTLKKVSKAYARLFLDDTVRVKHVERAASLMRRTLKSIDFEVGEDSLDDMWKQQVDSDELVEVIRELEQENGDGVAWLDQIADRTGASESEVKSLCNKLDQVAEHKHEGYKAV